jgi:hypothetical protein
MDLQQIIALFTEIHTAELADRHAQSIIELCDQMNNELVQTGFFYKELSDVSSVINLAWEELVKSQKVKTTVTVFLV